MSSIATNNALASDAGATAAHLDKPAVNPNLGANDVSLTQKQAAQSIQEIYENERAKRMRTEGSAQFINLSQSEKYRYLAGDCWAEGDSIPRLELQNGMHAKVFIVGGGFGGLVYAVRMIQAGIKPQDIIIADAAGGYGGTWYWNRYPGLMCDVESYIYLPLLEETGYMPKHKYSYGSEIREYANRIANQWHLQDRGAFQQSVQNLDWDDNHNHWRVQSLDLITKQKTELTAEFVVIAPGLLHNPKLSDFKGIDDYRGQAFHTARWNYNATGGSPEDPSLTKLEGKRVGIIGTGATAIQAVPHLARWAKELYIFQRTPSSVDRRDQRETDPEEFAEMTDTKNWQWERTKNFNSFINNAPDLPAKDMVNDGWTNFPSYNTLLGTPKKVTMETIADHVASNHALDIPRQTHIRNRVSRIVQDSTTAEKLKPWYSGWCKRPCFHDEYLQTFNQPHVKLIDTDGKGVTRLSQDGIIANNTEYPVDIIVFSTGYSIEAMTSPTRRANITTHGRNARPLDSKWADRIATLHGLLTHDFPNLFFSGPAQTTASANFSSCLDLLARQSAYIVSTAQQHAKSENVVIEPTAEAEEEWAQRIMAGAIVFAGVAGCTPSYLNGEGENDALAMEEKMKRARMSMWGGGMNEYADILEQWRKEGQLKGLHVTAV